jgi:uncharacterized protein YbjT (DUF2867 family)
LTSTAYVVKLIVMATAAASDPRGLRVAIFGTTGLAGRGVLRACIEEPRVLEIRAVVRRPLEPAHEGDDGRLRSVRCTDFADPSAIAGELEGLDALLWCLGISASKVDGEAEYRRITHDYALAAARLLRERSPAATFHFVSGAGTSAASRMMWARVKGHTELALAEVGLGGLVCWRPGMILADRSSAPRSLGPRVLHGIVGGLSFIPTLAIRATAIGHAMLQATLEGRRQGTLENRAMRELARRYRAHATG